MQLGGYRHVSYSEDSDLYWRLQELGSLHNITAVLGDYRVHGQSISSSSVVNGRIQAVGSQLGALSALRRRSGLPDMVFPADAIAGYKAAGTLKAIVAIASEQLDAQEKRRFRHLRGRQAYADSRLSPLRAGQRGLPLHQGCRGGRIGSTDPRE